MGSPKGLPHICIALFTGHTHKFVANVVTDDTGAFRFGELTNGEYRMIIRAPGFYVAEIPIHVVRKSDDKGKASKPMDVLL